MGQSKGDKWYSRAERYLELFNQKGHAAATEYLMQFGDKAEKVIEALNEVQEIEAEAETAYRAEMKRRIADMKAEKAILGNSMMIPGIDDKEEEVE
jgi:hypothetical protein